MAMLDESCVAFPEGASTTSQKKDVLNKTTGENERIIIQRNKVAKILSQQYSKPLEFKKKTLPLSHIIETIKVCYRKL